MVTRFLHLALLFVAVPEVVLSQDVYDLLNRGEYQQVRRQLSGVLDSGNRPTYKEISAYFDTYLFTGELAAGLQRADALMRRWPTNPAVDYNRGRLLSAAGRYEEAEDALTAAIRAKGDYWEAGMELADLYDATGRSGQAMRIYAVLRSRYKRGLFETASELTLAGRAAAGLREYHDANEAISTALRLQPGNVENLSRHAQLFLATYDAAVAAEIYAEAVTINPNRADLYVGLARASDSFSRKEELAKRAIERVPNSVGAKCILAGLLILDGDYPGAQTLLKKTIAANPSSMDALAHMAAVHILRGDSTAFAALERRALAVNPRAAEFYVTAGELLALRFRYHESVDVARKAVAVDPSDAAANAALGTALMRLGRPDEARRYLSRSYERDAFNLIVANTLSLIDSYDEFETLESEHFRLLIHTQDSGVLGELILDVAEDCYRSLSERYPYEPKGKILLEAYNDADDFAVRVAGVPHLGLLGVSFGDILAVKTPRSDPGRPTNWARTVWHEIAHTMAIGTSRYKVPRWLTEGLSVYEERLAREEWGREMEVEFFLALEKDRLHDLEDINRGFTRPEFRGQVLLSYYHAYRIVDFIVERFGFEAVTQMLLAFGRGLDEESAVRDALGLSRRELDRAFRADLEGRRQELASILRNWPDVLDKEDEQTLLERLAGKVENLYLRLVQEGWDALARGNLDGAEDRFSEAQQMYPAFVNPGNPHLGLAAVYRQRGDTLRLERVLEGFLVRSDYGAAEARELAELYAAQGELSHALQYFKRTRTIEPYDQSTLIRIAELQEETGRWAEAARTRRTILALDPVDRADALYRLAVTLHAGGQFVLSKRAVLESLEIAPGFRDAQRLLLTLVEL